MSLLGTFKLRRRDDDPDFLLGVRRTGQSVCGFPDLIGLGFGTVGGIFVAYDVVYGPGRRWQAEVIATQARIHSLVPTPHSNDIGSYHSPLLPLT